MKFLSLTLLFLVIISCKNESKLGVDQSKQINKLIEVYQAKHSLEKEYIQNVLEKGYKNNNTDFQFEKTKEAINFIKQFSVKKTVFEEEREIYRLLFSNVLSISNNLKLYKKLLEKIPTSTAVLDEYAFIFALILAVRNYNWSTKIQTFSINKIKSYFHFKLFSIDTNVIHLSTTLNLLSKYFQHVKNDKKNSKIIEKLQSELETKLKELKLRYDPMKDNARVISTYHYNEQLLVNDYRIKAILSISNLKL